MDEVNLGHECDDIIKNLSRDMERSKAVIGEIRDKGLVFYVETVEKSIERLYYIRDQFGDYDKAALEREWRPLPTEFDSQPEIPLDMLSFNEMWKTIFSRRGWDGNAPFPLLASLVGCIRSLPHSNASAEMTFFLLPGILTKERNRLSNESVSALTVAKSATKLEARFAPTFNEEQLSLISE